MAFSDERRRDQLLTETCHAKKKTLSNNDDTKKKVQASHLKGASKRQGKENPSDAMHEDDESPLQEEPQGGSDMKLQQAMEDLKQGVADNEELSQQCKDEVIGMLNE